MNIHPTTVESYEGNLRELAGEVSLMDYRSIGKFLQLLAIEMEKQGKHDIDNNKPIMGELSNKIGIQLHLAKYACDDAFKLAKKYMIINEYGCPECGWEPPEDDAYEPYTEIDGVKYPKCENYHAVNTIDCSGYDWKEIHYCPNCEKEFSFVNGTC